jgi:hypothetical protein
VVKRPSREADYLPPPTAEVKDEWSYIFIPQYAFRTYTGRPLLLFDTHSSSSAALQPGVGFDLLYKVIPLLSISSQLLPVLQLEHLHIFEDSIDPSILGSILIL